MGINIPNFLSSKSKNHKMIDFQDLDHIDGLSISTVSAKLYKTNVSISLVRTTILQYINSTSYQYIRKRKLKTCVCYNFTFSF